MFNVSSAATNVTLGTGFSKTAVASQGLGVSGENLTFSYHTNGGAVVTGQIEYIGTPYLNNIALIVNTTTGQATLKNDTLQSLSIDGYSILSSTGALNGATWNSLADRPGTLPQLAGIAGRRPTPSRRRTPWRRLTLTAGQSISLGNIGNFSRRPRADGLSMKFILGNETTFRLATISFTSGTGPTGRLRRRWPTSTGTTSWSGSAAARPIPLSTGDLATWRTNYGAGAAVAAARGGSRAGCHGDGRVRRGWHRSHREIVFAAPSAATAPKTEDLGGMKEHDSDTRTPCRCACIDGPRTPGPVAR